MPKGVKGFQKKAVAVSEKGTSDQKAKPRSFTRMETLASSVPAHPDVDPARAMLRSGSRGNKRRAFPCLAVVLKCFGGLLAALGGPQ